MGTRHLLTEIGMTDLERAFDMSDEDLHTDLSAIRISMIRDVHYNDVELHVLIFGQDGCDEEDAVAALWIDPDVVGASGELADGGIEPSRLRAIFSEEVLSMVATRSIPVQWLCDDGESMTVSLTPGEGNGIRLLPVDQ